MRSLKFASTQGYLDRGRESVQFVTCSYELPVWSQFPITGKVSLISPGAKFAVRPCVMSHMKRVNVVRPMFRDSRSGSDWSEYFVMVTLATAVANETAQSLAKEGARSGKNSPKITQDATTQQIQDPRLVFPSVADDSQNSGDR
jgi:hypothetical protein